MFDATDALDPDLVLARGDVACARPLPHAGIAVAEVEWLDAGHPPLSRVRETSETKNRAKETE
jgi:hypothetical protein